MQFRASKPSDARVAPRTKTFQPAVVRQGSREHRAHILDVSTSGAELHLPSDVAVGSLLTLACDQVVATARVVWTTGQRCGVHFSRALSVQELQVIAQLPI
jgi:hypothetical protein